MSGDAERCPRMALKGQASVRSALLLERRFTPMQAANALYSDGSGAAPEAIVTSLSRQVFDAGLPQPSSRLRRLLAAVTLRILKKTTRTEVRTGQDDKDVISYRNRVLERSNHPYVLTLLRPSDADSATFVEGGDPMNAPYMMLLPEIRQNAAVWDRLLLDSVIGRDVQLRFVWETKITHEMASRRLNQGESVRLKAAAAGTGLSLIVVYDRLIREGHDPRLISATITDRAAANVTKARRLLRTLPTTQNNPAKDGKDFGISAQIEDLFEHRSSGDEEPHIVTLVGILEYFHGFTFTTTEESLGHSAVSGEEDAEMVLRKIGAMTAESGTLIANSYRTETGARLLEVFGKRFRYRNREHLHALVETAGFVPTGIVGSGHIYDVEAFEKRPTSRSDASNGES
jgi:hypothetical protein